METLGDQKIRDTYLGCGECGMKVHSRGLCMTHYQAARRGGYLDDYPPDALHQRDYADTVIMQVLHIHGVEIVEEALATFRVANADGVVP